MPFSLVFRTVHKKHTDTDTFFESPCYQGFDNLAAVSALSLPLSDTLRPDPTYDQAHRPDPTYYKADDRVSTYDVIDDLGPKGCSGLEYPEPDYPGRHTNEYTSLSTRHGVAHAPLSREYESLHRGEPDYLQPVMSNPNEAKITRVVI